MNNFIKADWPAPKFIHAFSTTRASSNLAKHVGDAPENVQKNREILRENLKLPAEPIWLHQVHSTKIVRAEDYQAPAEADASFTARANTVCAVLTADCLPLLLCAKDGSEIAAIHAGWRGLANGIISCTFAKLATPASECLVWLGPAIGPEKYEVGEDLRQAFLNRSTSAEIAFKTKGKEKWLADLYTLAKQELLQCGVKETAIYGGKYCTFSDAERFYSYRRDGANTGRMATLIWKD